MKKTRRPYFLLFALPGGKTWRFAWLAWLGLLLWAGPLLGQEGKKKGAGQPVAKPPTTTAAQARSLPDFPGWKAVDDAEATSTFAQIPFRLSDEQTALLDTYGARWTEFTVYKNGTGAHVLIEIHQFRDVRWAWGYFRRVRPPDFPSMVDLGTESWLGPDSLVFVWGTRLVRLAVVGLRPGDGPVLEEMARKVLAGMDERPGLPTQLRLFPQEGLEPNSEAYVPVRFMTQDCLPGVFTARYRVRGKSFQLFLLEAPNETEAQRMVDCLVSSMGGGAIQGRSRDLISMHDEDNGDVLLQRDGQRIWGAVGECGSAVRPLLSEIERRWKNAGR